MSVLMDQICFLSFGQCLWHDDMIDERLSLRPPSLEKNAHNDVTRLLVRGLTSDSGSTVAINELYAV